MTTKPLFRVTASLALSSGSWASEVQDRSEHWHTSDDRTQLFVKNARVRTFLPTNNSSVDYLGLSNQGNSAVTLTKETIEAWAGLRFMSTPNVNVA